jgi:hypothetical protein
MVDSSTEMAIFQRVAELIVWSGRHFSSQQEAAPLLTLARR